MTRTIVAAIFGALAAVVGTSSPHGGEQSVVRNEVRGVGKIAEVREVKPEFREGKPEFQVVKGVAGFWRLGETNDGVWWYVSPGGKTEFLNSVTTVRPMQAGRAGDDYQSSDYQWRDLHHWAEVTLGHVKAAGFKGLGAWCSPEFHRLDVPMTRDLNLATWARGYELGSRAWCAAIDKAAREQCSSLRENRNLVGYFIDNELDWNGAEGLAEEYFRITTAAIRKYDPNHLILGVRYKGWAPAEVVRASRKYVDAQSINYYPNDALLDPQIFATIHEESGQAMIISEYSFHSLDGRSGNRNTYGFPGLVADQTSRAEAYRSFTTRVARVPYIVGADWFQWVDEPGSGRAADGEDANFGVVDVKDRAYEKLVDAVRETGPKLNGVHEGSGRDDGVGVYRKSYASAVERTSDSKAPSP